MKNNPFTLMYGIASESMVAREDSIREVIDAFTLQNNMYAYLILGIRGSGKTVLLRTIEKRLTEEYDWIVLNINPQGDILSSIANQLYDIGLLRKIIGNIKLTINLGIVTLTRENGEKTSDPEIIINHILSLFKKANINVLVSIDEVNDTSEFRKFINYFQIVIDKKMPMYLLMTALQENVNSLINDRAMTFLSRAPKIVLEPLSIADIALNYAEIFDIDIEEASKMAKITNGYAFAYQVLGYLLFESGKKTIDKELKNKYNKYLWQNGYNKFWNDLTDVEKKFVIAIAMGDGSKSDIIARGFLQTNYSQYRRRLIEKGLVYMKKHGSLAFVLPSFKEYVLFIKEFEEE